MMTAPFATPATRILERAASNEYYGRAVGTLEYRRAAELRHKAFLTRGGLPVTEYPKPPASVDDDLSVWLEDIARAAAQERARNAKHEALSALIGQCERIIQAAATPPDRLLASLADDLDDLMARVADAVQRLDGARSSRDALMKGGAAVEVWRDELPQLRADYDAIREAQQWVMAGDDRATQARSRYLDDPLASDLAIANLDAVFANWRDHAPGIQTVGHEPDPRPWPVDDELAQLIWLVTSPAKPWVPTTRQLDDLWAERRRSRAHPTTKTTAERSDKKPATTVPTINNDTREDTEDRVTTQAG